MTEPKLYERKKTGRLVPCDGEAHSNPFIDNCLACAPRWGEVEELEPVDLVEARSGGFDVAVGDLSEEQQDELLKAGVPTSERRVERRGCTSWFMVFRFGGAS